jgi:hypothetical protein
MNDMADFFTWFLFITWALSAISIVVFPFILYFKYLAS